MPRDIPDRWTDYRPYGSKVAETRFVAFKVPLRSYINERVEENLRLDAQMLIEAIPDLGLVIDLTDTNRYYNPECFEKLGVQYRKLRTPGHVTPSHYLVRRFNKYVDEYLRSNKHNNKLIGVHCTHGVNRTGFFICNYMISEMTMSADDAIKKFSDARGHAIERQNYLRALKNMNSDISEISMQRKDNNSECYLHTSNCVETPTSCMEDKKSDHLIDVPHRSKHDTIPYSDSAPKGPTIPIRIVGLMNLEQRWNNKVDPHLYRHRHRHRIHNERSNWRSRDNAQASGRHPYGRDYSNDSSRFSWRRSENNSNDNVRTIPDSSKCDNSTNE